MFPLRWFLIQVKAFRNSFRENKKEFLWQNLWHFFIIAGGLALIYFFLYALFGFIARKGFPAFDFAFIFLSFMLLLLLPLVFYSGLICSLSFLFQKEENTFYFSLPVGSVSLFTVKFSQTYVHTAWMVFLAFMTFIAAVQQYFHTTPMIYLIGGVACLIFLLIPVCAAVILVLVVSCFVPFVRAKGILTVIGLFVGSVLVSAVRVMQPERFVTGEGKMVLVTFVQSLHKPWMTVFPGEWVTNALFAQVNNDARGIMVNCAGLFVLAALAMSVMYGLVRRQYQRIWAESSVVSSPVDRRFAWQDILVIFPVSLRHFIRKDLLGFYRNITERGSLLTLLPLCFVYFYSIHVLQVRTQGHPEEQIFSFLFLYLFVFFYTSVVVAGLSGRWVFPSVSIEGNNFKLIRAAGVSMREFCRAKFFLGFIPLLILSQILVFGSSFLLRLKPGFCILSSAAMFLLSWGITRICLIQGIRNADFTVQDPLEFALSFRGFICLIWEFMFAVAVIILIGLPTAALLYKGFSRIFILSVTGSFIGVLSIIGILTVQYRAAIKEIMNREI
jgi:ABC-2 type transport system permease protein